jgi:hypothetical protein
LTNNTSPRLLELVFLFSIFISYIFYNLYIKKGDDPVQYMMMIETIKNGGDMSYFFDHNREYGFQLFLMVMSLFPVFFLPLSVAFIVAYTYNKVQVYLHLNKISRLIGYGALIFPGYQPLHYMMGAWRQSISISVLIIGLLNFSRAPKISILAITLSLFIHSSSISYLMVFLVSFFLYRIFYVKRLNLVIFTFYFMALSLILFQYTDVLIDKASHYQGDSDSKNYTFGFIKYVVMLFLLSLILIKPLLKKSFKVDTLFLFFVLYISLVLIIGTINAHLGWRILNGVYIFIPLYMMSIYRIRI